MSDQFLEIGDDFQNVFPKNPATKKHSGWLWGLLALAAAGSIYLFFRAQKRNRKNN